MTSDASGAAPAAAERLRERFGDEVVLVTGFPGGRAQALLQVLLEREPEIAIWLVVPPSELEASARLLAGNGSEHRRLRLIPGEPCAIDLGLSRQTYSELALQVDRWFALYQTSDPTASRELSLRVNLGAAREVAELCKVAEKLTRVTLLSSGAVFGDHQGPVSEEELRIGQSFPSSAAQALALAEALLTRKLSDVPVSIVRTPQVLRARGQATSLKPSGLHRLLALVASAPTDALLPLPPGSSRVVQAIPADFLAEALYAVSVLGTRGHAYHFADPDPPSLLEVLQRAAQYFGKRFELGGGARAFGRMLLNSPGFWLSQQSSRALSEWAAGPPLVTRAGDRLLERAGLRAPSLLDYLDDVLRETEQLVKSAGLDLPVASTPIEAVA
ncbi:MAG TPA: SDR family oxidoreductase [Polyangiaceae bacterium]